VLRRLPLVSITGPTRGDLEEMPVEREKVIMAIFEFAERETATNICVFTRFQDSSNPEPASEQYCANPKMMVSPSESPKTMSTISSRTLLTHEIASSI
jgi:hypothetical protein